MSARNDAIQKHISDMVSVEKHILEAIERQRGDENARNNIEANRVFIEIERTLKAHVAALDELAESYGGTGESAIKKAVTSVIGSVAGLYDQVREHPVSRMLRDDYTALSLDAMGYTAFHTFGLAVKEQRVANTAQQHLQGITPLLIEISKVLPPVVAQEVADEAEDFAVDATVGQQAVTNTQRAWERDITERA